MHYIAVRWLHDFEVEPIESYSELDDENWELRKVEVFRDGRYDFADADRESDTTGLSETPIPPLDEIAADPQFVPRKITAAEFELIWNRAIS